MSRRPSFIKLTPGQIAQLDSAMKQAVREERLRFRRRLQTIWFSQDGWSVDKISEHLNISQQSIWKYRRIYKAKGLEGLRGKYLSRKL